MEYALIILLMSFDYFFSMSPKQDDIEDGFPFEIENNPGQRTIILKSNYQNETIRVEVDMPQPDEIEEGENDDDDDDDTGDNEAKSGPSIPLVVSITK